MNIYVRLRVNEIPHRRGIYIPLAAKPAVTSRGNRVVFPRKRLCPPTKIYSERWPEEYMYIWRCWWRYSGGGWLVVLRGNREIRPGKTFEYKSSVSICLAKRFIYK